MREAWLNEARPRKVVTFKTTLEEEEHRTATGIQWRKTNKQRKERRTQEVKMDERGKKEEMMRKVYNLLLDANDTRLETALNESEALSQIETENEDHETAAEKAMGFMSQWRSLWMIWKVDGGRTFADFEGLSAGQKLEGFRRKYAGKTMEEACGGTKAKGQRYRCLDGFANNGVTKAYLGIWRQSGNTGDETTSGEDIYCTRAVYRSIFRQIPGVGQIVADHVDKEGILMMPSRENDESATVGGDAAPPNPPPAAAAAVGSAVGGERAASSAPPGAAIQAFEGKGERPEASDNNKKRKEDDDDDEKITTTTSSNNNNNPRKKQKVTENADG